MAHKVVLKNKVAHKVAPTHVCFFLINMMLY